MMRVFACASARWGDEAAIDAELDALPRTAILVQIKPDGADNAAIARALARGFACEDEVPHHDDAYRHGPRVWRVLMLRVLDSRPDLVLVFQLDKAPALTEIADEARARGISVKIIAGRRPRRKD
jgi:hypothetical protein